MKYKCSICGNEYDSLADYAACVNKCAEEQKRNEERIRKENLEKEKSARLEELKKAERAYNDLFEKYIDDYGRYESHSVYPKAWFSPFNLFL